MPDLSPETPPAPEPALETTPPVQPEPTEPVVAAQGPEQFLALLDEGLYQKTRGVLAAPGQAASGTSAWFWLVVTLGLFMLSLLRWESSQAIVMVVLVLLLHESGHFLGMRLFGYRNVRMFFIPFFGAAVSGDKHAAPAWQRGIILLLGPLPGILLALALVLTCPIHSRSGVGDLVVWLIIINALNLLPLVPLDGGRLVDLLFFSRRPALSAGFQALASVGLAVLAWAGGACVLWLLVACLLIAVPARHRRARLERVFAGNPGRMPATLEELDEGQHRELFGWAVFINRMTRTPDGVAAAIRELHEHMVTRPLGVWSWIGLLLLYLGGWAAGVSGLLTLTANTQRENGRLAGELVTRFELATTKISALHEEAGRLEEAAKRDPAASTGLKARARQKKEQADQEWAGMVAGWRAQPESIQVNALQRVVGSPAQTPQRQRFALRLARELGLGKHK
jgi:Zn-dependent protease